MRDRTAFAALAVLLTSVAVLGMVMRLRSASAAEQGPAAAPSVRFPPPPLLAAPSAAPRPTVAIHPAVHPPPPRGGGKTLERLAADAFHAGDRHRAAVLYAELAARTPENPAFAAAASLCR